LLLLCRVVVGGLCLPLVRNRVVLVVGWTWLFLAGRVVVGRGLVVVVVPGLVVVGCELGLRPCDRGRPPLLRFAVVVVTALVVLVVEVCLAVVVGRYGLVVVVPLGGAPLCGAPLCGAPRECGRLPVVVGRDGAVVVVVGPADAGAAVVGGSPRPVVAVPAVVVVEALEVVVGFGFATGFLRLL
jgi:hypothetical protein